MSRRTPRRAAPNPPPPQARRPLPWAAIGGGIGVLLILALAGWWWQRGPAFAPQPDADQNVLLVTIDTLRADALSSYGGPADTPNLDRLAAHGARFTFAHAHAVMTLVSHTTMLTGRYPYEHGVRDNSGYRVRPGTATAATRLKALGFATGAFVGGYPLLKRFGLGPGFDVYDDRITEGQGAVDFALSERRADLVVARALDWINGQQGRFFAWVHVFDPHAPYRPPAEWLARYAAQPYYGEVAWTDHALGPLFDRLATLPRRTLVIVTSDHGEGLGDHGEATHGMFAYEATLHVPLIVAEIDPQATRAPRGVVVTTPVRHIDILPTILDAVTAAADHALPGASLLDVIRRGSGGDRPEYFEAMAGNVARDWAPLRGVLVGLEKYIDLPIPERYDLARDPRELQNLATADAGETQVLLNTLRTYNVAPPGRPAQEVAAVAEMFRSLGYVSSGPQPDKQTFTEDDDPKRLIKIDQELANATELYQNRRYQESIALFQKVIGERPGTADAYKSLASVYWEIGQPAAAIATLETALQRGARNREVPVRLGRYLSEAGQSARAIVLLQQLPQDDVDVLNALGTAYGRAGRNADALQTFRRAIAVEPDNAAAYQNIAVVQLMAGQVREAEASLKRALEADPALADAYTTLGVVFSQTGRKTEAIESWKRAVEIDGREYQALLNLTIELAAAGHIEEARAYGQRFVVTAPPAYFKDDIARVRQLIGG